MTTLCIADNHSEAAGYRCRCDNCGECCRSDQLAPIHDAQLRLTPGEETPAGECPKCGALAFVMKRQGKAS